MKIGKTIKPQAIADSLSISLEKAVLVKKICNFDGTGKEFYTLLLENGNLFPKYQFPHIHDFLLDYRPKFWWETYIKYLDVLIETCGVEGLSTGDYSCIHSVASYCNAGDTYNTTIIWDNLKKEFSIGCYGDLVEFYERTKHWAF